MNEDATGLVAVLQATRKVLDESRGNIKPERGYAEELEADIDSAINAIDGALASVQTGGEADFCTCQWHGESVVKVCKFCRSNVEALQKEVERLKALSVENILIDVVPGDGSGHEVYAKSVQEVVDLLTRLSQQVEGQQLAQPAGNVPDFELFWMHLQEAAYAAEDQTAFTDDAKRFAKMGFDGAIRALLSTPAVKAEQLAAGPLPEGWAEAYAAFKGAFDTPMDRLQNKSELAQDARRRLWDFNKAMLAAAPVLSSEWQG